MLSLMCWNKYNVAENTFIFVLRYSEICAHKLRVKKSLLRRLTWNSFKWHIKKLAKSLNTRAEILKSSTSLLPECLEWFVRFTEMQTKRKVHYEYS